MSPFTAGNFPPSGIVASTADLTPSGILGYAKVIAAFVSGLITVLIPFLPIESDVAHWAQVAVAVCGFIAVYAIPNKVVPVPVDPSAPAAGQV
jgi:hypothetical protein